MARSVIPSGYERSDVTAKTIAFIAIGIALFLFVVPFIIQMVFRSDQPAIDLAEMKKPPEPLLQIDPAGEIETFNQAEQKQLGSFGPTGKGAFHIPIDQAKDRIVQRGLPGWSPDTAPVKSP